MGGILWGGGGGGGGGGGAKGMLPPSQIIGGACPPPLPTPMNKSVMRLTLIYHINLKSTFDLILFT